MSLMNRWRSALFLGGIVAAGICCKMALGSDTAPIKIWQDAPATQPAEIPTQVYQARDTVQWTADPSAEAQAELDQFKWTPGKFDVQVTHDVQEQSVGLPAAYPGPSCYAMVRFLSPLAKESVPRDTVVMEWYAAKSADGELLKTPAIVVIPESDPRMAASRRVAQGFAAHGIHAFLMQSPGYGLRRDTGGFLNGKAFLDRVIQGVADARRARDAVAALPQVNSNDVNLLGTSLGAFGAELTASIDHGYTRVFVILGGGNFYNIIMGRGLEATIARTALYAAQIQGDTLRQLIQKIEPLVVAHRIDSQHTWLCSAADDTVVPIANATAWAQAANLPPDHHVIVPGNHYSVIGQIPVLLAQVKSIVMDPSPQSPRVGE